MVMMPSIVDVCRYCCGSSIVYKRVGRVLAHMWSLLLTLCLEPHPPTSISCELALVSILSPQCQRLCLSLLPNRQARWKLHRGSLDEWQIWTQYQNRFAIVERFPTGSGVWPLVPQLLVLFRRWGFDEASLSLGGRFWGFIALSHFPPSPSPLCPCFLWMEEECSLCFLTLLPCLLCSDGFHLHPPELLSFYQFLKINN